MAHLYLGTHSLWPFSDPILKLCSGEQSLPSFFSSPRQWKADFLLKKKKKNRMRTATPGKPAVALTGPTMKHKRPDVNLPAHCPFQRSWPYCIGPDTGLIPSRAAESPKYTGGLRRRVCNSKNSFRKAEKNVTWNKTERNGPSSNFPAQLWGLSSSQVSPGFS